MKTNLHPWRVAIPVIAIPIMVGALVLIGADVPAPDPGSKDSDQDGLSDAYEVFYGLCPTNAGDARADYDGDGLDNIGEFAKMTDPFAPDTDRDMFPDNFDSEISRAYLGFGDLQFTHGDQYSYVAQDYIVNVYRIDGDWQTNPACWHVAADEKEGIGSLNVDLDRSLLGSNNLCYQLTVFDHTNSSLHVDLIGTNQDYIALDLYGNLLSGTETNAVLLLDVPLADYPLAAVIHLRRGFGECTVWSGLIYEDADFDGLDSAQERQIGTSDYKIDSNNNGIDDFSECFHLTNNVSTNAPIEPGGVKPPDNEDQGNPTGIIWVDQAKGDDAGFNGRSATAVSGKKDGPLKTCSKGMQAVDRDKAHTLVIQSGTYNESVNISGKQVDLVVRGNVRLTKSKK